MLSEKERAQKGKMKKKKNQQKLELNRAGRPEGGSYTL